MKSKILSVLIPNAALAVAFALTLGGCSGDDGARGPAGAPGEPGATGPEGPGGIPGDAGGVGEAGISQGTLSGTVTNSITQAAVEGVTVSFSPSVVADLTTDNTGAYTTVLPVGVYTVTFTKDSFTDGEATVPVAAGLAQTVDIELVPAADVIVDAGKDLEGAPGSNVSPTATSEIYDNSTGATYAWTQKSGVPLTITGETTATPTITLADLEAYKVELAKQLAQPDRFMLLGVDPFALEEAETAVFEVAVTTSSGTYKDTVNVVADLGLTWTTGVQNVPIDQNVIFQAKEDSGGYSWTVTGPSGSTAAFDSATSRWPILKPDVKGEYTITETKSGDTFTFFGGEWKGIITGVNATDGRPDVDTLCGQCHDDSTAPDKITSWRKSGHSEIFTQNMSDPNNHWSTGCANCHGVGYNPDATNGGWDEAMASESWTVPHPGGPNVYKDMFTSAPKTASLANIQCENCHGPQDSSAHKKGAWRVSDSSQMCGSCHGEPARHGRYQQWKESGHSNYTLALDEATVESRGATAAHCGRCHSSAGFKKWITQGDLTKYIQGGSGNATVAELTAMGLTEASVHPQTCVTCHDPHAQGDKSGEPNTATVRVEGDTGMLPAGYNATGVGKGALCMTCHNTRNGAHGDSIALTSQSAPHVAAQADVLMGKNVYFVNGTRGGHSYITNTCVTCHMNLTDPPAEYSYNKSGTNHTFEADPTICTSCHGTFDGGSLKQVMAKSLDDLDVYLGDSAMAKLNALGTVYVRAYDPTTDLYSSSGSTDANIALDVNANPIKHIAITEGHGQIEFHFTLTTAITITWSDNSQTTTDNFGVQIRAVKSSAGTGGTAVYAPSGNMTKACWNYLMLHADGSHGIHNPDFFMSVVNASMAVNVDN